MNVERVATALRRSALLERCDERTVDDLAAAGRSRELPRGATLFVEGEAARAVYVVVSGLLRVFATSLDGSESTITLLFPGDHFGELGVLDGSTRSSSVAALRATRVIEIPASAFTDALDRDRAFNSMMLLHLARRLRSTSGRLRDLTVLDLGARLAKYLSSDVDDAAPAPRDVTLTQSELGHLVGAARQSVNRELGRLERDGLIVQRGRAIEIRDPNGLRLRAAG